MPHPSSSTFNSSRLKAEFPGKLQCLFRPARYKILHGGRGGAKSWGIARALLILGSERPLRIACGREIQNAISDSVHQLLRNQIDQLGLGDAYTVRERYIEGANGTLITFHGLGKNINSVKSIEGIDIFWAEEAQSITKASWDILIPTIRKEGSEIWVSFNPDLETDETYRRFVLDPPLGATVVRINWRDNPWFNEVLRGEMEDTRRRSEDDYLHVWEGHSLVLVRLERFRLAFQMVASELSRKSPGNVALVHAKALLDDAFTIEPDLPEDLKTLIGKLDALKPETGRATNAPR